MIVIKIKIIKDKNKIDHNEWLYAYLTKLDYGIINDQEKWDVRMPNRDTIDNIVNSSNNSANYNIVCGFNTNKILNGIRTNDLNLNGNGKMQDDSNENNRNTNKSSLTLDIIRFTLTYKVIKMTGMKLPNAT